MNIYVGNLPYQTTESELESIFAEYGAVTSVRIITDRDSGRSKGFGFVEMEDDSAAENAITNLNGSEVGGRTIKVNKARPRPERTPRRY